MKIGIIGLGLIGGSLAKAIKLHTKHTVYGSNRSEEVLKKAELTEAIDGRLTDETLPDMDLVIVALYPHQIVKTIKEKAGLFKDGALVIDCGGVKRFIMEELRDTVAGRPWHFIGGHPMAGREYSGFRYAKDDLFDGASMILTPDDETPIDLLSDAKAFFLAIGFGRVVFTTPEEHDEMIAYTSQMAHILSSVYIRSELALKHKGFSAGSFLDMTRVARLNETMWAELFLLNRDALVSELDGLINRVVLYRDALAAEDEEGLTRLLREGRERKEFLDE
ncbi:MAG: prephenate dehydrogenase [Clostridiales bacterium]|nr:prephenate dehydrogenase [Clostridiales bacterium]